MNWPRISIITPTLNHEYFLAQTINSVIGQEYHNLEYIVIDGGSSDGTLDLLKKQTGKLIWISEPDGGQSDAINKGIRMARGEIIGILNSDDLYEPGALKRVGEFFIKNPHANWLTGKCKIVDKDGTEIRRIITQYKNFWLGINKEKVLCVLNYVSQPATFIRRELVETIGEFDKTLDLAMDYDYWLRAKKITDLYVLQEYLAQFRLYSTSKSGLGYQDQFAEELAIAHRHCTSKTLLFLHEIHKRLVTTTYGLSKK